MKKLSVCIQSLRMNGQSLPPKIETGIDRFVRRQLRATRDAVKNGRMTKEKAQHNAEKEALAYYIGVMQADMTSVMGASDAPVATPVDVTPEVQAVEDQAPETQAADTATPDQPRFSKARQTDTPAFKKWFGKSKVVDADGKPLVVYHGTTADFTAFSDQFFGEGDGRLDWGDGFYFTDRPDAASQYAEGPGGNVRPVYLSITNPATNKVMMSKRVQNALDDDMGFESITEVLEDMGYDGIVYTHKDGAKEIIALRPEQIKSAIGNDGNFDAANPDIRKSTERGAWGVDEPGKGDSFIRSLQDKMVDLKRVVEAVKKSGKDISDRWNPYLQEELYHGRTAKRSKDFLESELRPLLQDMQMRGATIEELGKFLHARHAEERNIQIAKINPDMQDGGSGLTTAAAKKYLADLPLARRSAMEALAARVDKINKDTAKLLVDSGLEKKSTIDAWNAAYKTYVPLHRDEVGQSGSGTGQGFSVRGSASKRAMGSTRDVVDILANVALQRERAIVRSEKNRVAQALWGLAAQNPNEDFWLAVDPNDDPATIAANLVKLGMNPLDAQGVATEPQQRFIDPRTGRVSWRVNPILRSANNVVSMRVDGEERYVYMNEQSERAMEMVKAVKNIDADQLGRVLSISQKISRYFSAINTQWNPIFGVVNFTRDVQGATLNLSTTPIAGKQAEVLRHTMPALKGIYTDLRAKRDGKSIDSAWAKLFEEFQNEGGQTGFRDMFANSKERADALQSEFNRITEGKAKTAGRAIFEWLTDYNDAMENAIRLSVYKVGKDNGMTNQQAASIAKSITVNFNRKGQVALQAGALYAFFNASAQGTARLVETLRGPAGKKIVYGGLVLGAAQALALAAAGFDDDEPPGFIRERSIIIPTGDGKYISIPMPLGLHVIPNLARIPTEFVLSGFKKPGDRLASLVNVFFDAFNPIGSAGLSIQTIAPTAVDPLVALAENRDFTGRPIAREDMSPSNPTPGHARAKDTASMIGRSVSYAINLMSGGTDYKPGVLSPTPDQIDYLIGQVTGGVGRESLKVMQTASAATTGEDLPLYKIPLFGRFVGDTTGQSSQANRFYSNLRELNGHKAEIEGRRKNREPIADYLKENPEYRLIPLATSTQRKVSELRSLKRKLVERDAPKERVKAIEDQITTLMLRLNERVEALAEAQ